MRGKYKTSTIDRDYQYRFDPVKEPGQTVRESKLRKAAKISFYSQMGHKWNKPNPSGTGRGRMTQAKISNSLELLALVDAGHTKVIKK